jgi:hypothetical protein
MAFSKLHSISYDAPKRVSPDRTDKLNKHNKYYSNNRIILGDRPSLVNILCEIFTQNIDT